VIQCIWAAPACSLFSASSMLSQILKGVSDDHDAAPPPQLAPRSFSDSS
jgi:hypothetical protein